MSGANASPTRSASAIARNLKEGRSLKKMKIRQHAWLFIVLSLIIARSSCVTAFGQQHSEYEHPPRSRWEVMPIGETAELLTLFFRQNEQNQITETEVPLLS